MTKDEYLTLEEQAFVSHDTLKRMMEYWAREERAEARKALERHRKANKARKLAQKRARKRSR